MSTLNLAKKIAVLGLASMLFACGGGGGNNSPNSPDVAGDGQDLESLPYSLESFDSFLMLARSPGWPFLFGNKISSLLPMHGTLVLAIVSAPEYLAGNQVKTRYDRPCGTGSASFVGDPYGEGSVAKYSYTANGCIYEEQATGLWADKSNDGYFDGSIDFDFTSNTRQVTTLQDFYMDSDIDDLSKLPVQNSIPSLTGTVQFDSTETESGTVSDKIIETISGTTVASLKVANHGYLSEYKYTVRRVDEIQNGSFQSETEYYSLDYKAQYTLSSTTGINLLDFTSSEVDGYYDIELKTLKPVKMINDDGVSEGTIVISLLSHQIIGKVTYFKDGYEVTYRKDGKSQFKRVYY